MKAIQKIKGLISPIKEVIRKIRGVWEQLKTPLRVGGIGSLLIGVLVTLKIAGVINIHWVWFYGLPLSLFLSMFAAVIIILIWQLWNFVKDLYNGEP